MRDHERQAAEDWAREEPREERKVIDASPAAVTLALLLTEAELDYLKCCGLLKGPQAAGSTFRRHERS